MVNWEIMKLVEYAAEKHAKAVAGGAKATHRKAAEPDFSNELPSSYIDIESESDIKDLCAGTNTALSSDCEVCSDAAAEKTACETPAVHSGKFSFAAFRDLWNEWAEHYGVAKFEKLTGKKRRLFEVRQRNFAKQGAYGEEFWVNLLSAVSEYGNGFYIGNNDGYNHDGRPWRVTFEWLMHNDDRVEKFIEAVG